MTAAAAANAEQSIEAITKSSGVNDFSLSQRFENPLYGEDLHDSKDPFNESNFDEEI